MINHSGTSDFIHLFNTYLLRSLTTFQSCQNTLQCSKGGLTCMEGSKGSAERSKGLNIEKMRKNRKASQRRTPDYDCFYVNWLSHCIRYQGHRLAGLVVGSCAPSHYTGAVYAVGQREPCWQGLKQSNCWGMPSLIRSPCHSQRQSWA